MKKYLDLAFVAILVLMTACSKQEVITSDSSQERVFVIKASMNDPEVKGTYDASGSFSWATGDKIGVDMWDETHNWPQYMTLSEGDGKKEGTFSTSQTYACGNVAFYPWNGWETGDAGTHFEASTQKLLVRLRPIISYNNDSGNPQNIIPVAAPISNQTSTDAAKSETAIKFKQIAAGIKVTVSGIPSYADKVSLTVNDANITGWFYIEKSNIDGSHGITYSSDGSSTVSITFDPSSIITSRTFVFPVPPTAIKGLTLKLYSLDSEIWSASTKAQPTLTVGQVLKLKDVTVSSPKQVIEVAIIEHISNRDDHVVYYRNDDSSVSGNASLTQIKMGGSTQKYKTIYMGKPYWEANKIFYYYSAAIPSAATRYKVHKDATWYGSEDGYVSYPYTIIYDYSGTHADNYSSYERSWDN